jgi:peroxiredoxin-like protein
MKPLPHDYEVVLTGASAGYATLSAAGLPDLTTATPTAYDGPGDAWSPEHLLLAAVSSCFLFTFRAVAKASHVEFLEVEAETAGTVDRTGGVTRFTDIVIRPTVTTPAGADAAAVQRAIEKAASRCLVSSSLVTPVRVEPTIRDSAAPSVAA